MSYVASEKRYEEMKYARCGASGLKLPLVSLGLWHNFGTDANMEVTTDMCHTAFDLGITHFDLANNYGPIPGAAEERFGKILSNGLGKYRDELVISTKAGFAMWDGPYGEWGSRKYLISSLDQSLKRMGLEYVDIFYHHRPDPETPLEETMLALDQIVRSGKALYVGISNYTKEQTVAAAAILKNLKTPFIINQRQYSILNPAVEEEGLDKYAREIGMGIIAFCPLEQGLLTDRYLNGIPKDSRAANKNIGFLTEENITDKNINKALALKEIASQRGQSLAQLALAYLVREGAATSVIIGASNSEQIVENVKMVENCTFSAEQIAMIKKIAAQ